MGQSWLMRLNMKDRTFLQKSVLLIISTLITGILGFSFTIVLSREIGPEGMGLFSLVFPINSLLLSIISGGMMIAISKIIAEYVAKNEFNNIRKCMNTALVFNLISSVIIIGIGYLLSFHISKYVINDIRSLHAFRLVLLASIFMTLSNTYKGYFFGTMKVTTPAYIDIFEKLLRILLILILFKQYHITDLTTYVTIAFAVFCIGELASLIFFFIHYRIDLREYEGTEEVPKSAFQFLGNIFSISIPLMITELIASSLYTVSALMIPRRLVVANFEYDAALELIGKFISMSMQIVFFPMIIIGAISTVLIPDLSSSISKEDHESIETRIRSVVRAAVVIGLIVLTLFMVFGNTIGELIYKRNDLGQYIKFLAICAPPLYVSAITRSILNGLGKQKIILRNSMIISVFQVVLLYTLIGIPSIHIFGFGLTILITSLISIYINVREIKKDINVRLL